MKRRSAAIRWIRVLSCRTLATLLAGIIALCLFDAYSDGAEPAGRSAKDAKFAAQLAAGEFAPALESALNSLNSDVRDQRLAEVSAAQFQAGMRAEGVQAAGQIRGDLRRLAALFNGQGIHIREGFMEAIGDPRHNDALSNDARGGAVEPDFESLIELIEGTIAPNTWDTLGGPGAIDEFAGGVFVDAQGVLAPLLKQDSTGRLGSLRITSSESRKPVEYASTDLPGSAGNSRRDVSRTSALRMVSLPRLERAAQMCLAEGKPLPAEMRYLAGLQRIKYVFVYPETGDLVLAGPAEGWERVEEGRLVGKSTRTPVLHLEDLVVILRHMFSADDASFGCSITPKQENLAQTKAFLEASGKTSLAIGQREKWLDTLREKLGKQTIDVYGLDPRTRAARVLVEADYRMKLVGMGLEPGVLGVESYLDQIKIAPGDGPPPMDVLRWWFTLNYQALLASKDRDAFEIRGQGVKVLSENELLTAQGKRIHTGKSDELNLQFTNSFTRHFPELAAKYPIYAELRNLCDLALVCALMREEKLHEKVSWHAAWFGANRGFPVQLATAPEEVETVINHRVIQRRHIVAGVSGGVRVDPNELVSREAMEVDTYGKLEAEEIGARPGKLPIDAWWWDRGN